MPKTILIVEDNVLNRKLFSDLLETNGYATIQASSGLEAFAMVRHHKPDLIIMDIQLPEVSGLEVVKWIKDDKDLNSIPIFAVTAFAMQGDKEMALSRGCEVYISKPLSITNFLKTVKQYVGGIQN